MTKNCDISNLGGKTLENVGMISASGELFSSKMVNEPNFGGICGWGRIN